MHTDYENSTRPSKKASGTTNRTNKKNNPSPSPFFAAKRPPQSPAEILTSWPWVFNSSGICWFLSWRLHCFPCAQQVWGKDHWFGKSVFTRTYLCTICTSTIQQFLSKELCHVKPRNGRISEDFLSLDFNGLGQGQHSYVSAARAKTEHWSSKTSTCPVICGTSKGSKGIRTRVKVGQVCHKPQPLRQIFRYTH